MSIHIKKSKSKLIQDYFRITPDRQIRLTRAYTGFFFSIILASIGITIAVINGGLGKGGLLCFILFFIAFLWAIVSVCKLFKFLIDDRDAKRFIEERIKDRSSNVRYAAQKFHDSTSIDDVITCHIINGYYLGSVNNKPCAFYRDDTNDVFCNHYECSVFIAHEELLYWYSSRFQLDTPTVIYEESGGALPYREIDSIQYQEYPLKLPDNAKQKITTYPFLDICLSNGDKLHFSIAHFGLFSKENRHSFEKEIQGLADLLKEYHAKISIDNTCALEKARGDNHVF